MKASPDVDINYVRSIDQRLSGKVKPLIRFIKAWKYARHSSAVPVAPAPAQAAARSTTSNEEDRHRAETGKAIALWLVSILGGGPLLHYVAVWLLSGSTTAPALQTTDFPL